MCSSLVKSFPKNSINFAQLAEYQRKKVDRNFAILRDKFSNFNFTFPQIFSKNFLPQFPV